MFVIDKSDSYKFPVKFHTPKEDGSGSEENTFTATFKRPSLTEIESIVSPANAKDGDIVRAFLIGWEDICDKKGEQVPFTKEIREKLIDVPAFASAVAKAFISSLQDAPRKN